MKTPLDVVRGRVVGYDEKAGDLIIKAHYDDIHTMLKRGYCECNVQMIDSRKLSDKQRNTCYKLLREIANYSGSDLGSIKEVMKHRFIEDELGEGPDFDFSLSDATMSLACAFEQYLVNFILEFDVPVSFPLLDFVDDVSGYIYACLISRKCCVCGKSADLHHWTRVGAGRSRKKLDHIGMLAEPLCRGHHIECHTMTKEEFDELYHIRPVEIDERIAEVWGLNGTRSRSDRNREWFPEE